MPKALIIVLVVALSGGLAFVAKDVFASKEEPAGASGGPSQRVFAKPTGTGRTPAFYLHLDTEQKMKSVEECLRGFTSAQAGVLGAIRDDLALLCFEPDVFERVLEAHAQRAKLTKYEASGFGDLFVRVKHPKFVSLTADLFTHAEFAVRHKAISSALTQAHPDLTPHLSKLLDELQASGEQTGEKTRSKLLAAAQACGGPQLPVVVSKGLKDVSPLVRMGAARIAGEAQIKSLGRALIPLMQDEARAVALRSAWSLCMLGVSEEAAQEKLISVITPADPEGTEYVLEAVRQLELKPAYASLWSQLESFEFDLKAQIVPLLCLLGYEPALERMRKALASKDGDPAERDLAAVGIASLNAEGDQKLILSIAKEGRGSLLVGLAAGFSNAAHAPDLEVAKIIMNSGVIEHPARVGSWPARIGDDFIEFSEEKLANASGDIEATMYISILGTIGSKRARAAIQKFHSRWPDFIEQKLRLMDLDRLKAGDFE